MYIYILLTLTNMILNFTLNQAIYGMISISALSTARLPMNPVQAFPFSNRSAAGGTVPGSCSKTFLGKQEPVPKKSWVQHVFQQGVG